MNNFGVGCILLSLVAIAYCLEGIKENLEKIKKLLEKENN